MARLETHVTAGGHLLGQHRLYSAAAGKTTGRDWIAFLRESVKAGAGEVLVSRTVRDLVAGSELRFVGRGEYELKGVPETWQLYALEA